jgi:ferredoxin-NADP reductase
VADFSGAKVYLAGPPGMVETISASLLERGLSEHDLHADAFYPPVRAELAVSS